MAEPINADFAGVDIDDSDMANAAQFAILQLETLAKFADSENAKLVVPIESAALMGAAQALRSLMESVPSG